MKLITTSALLLAASRPILADFRIYIGPEWDATEGGGVSSLALNLFNNAPDCDDKAVSYQQNWDNDASQSGFACDGCEKDENTDDWTIERLELPHSAEWEGADFDGILTIYNNDGTYDLLDDSGESWGTCERPSDPDTLDCGIPGGSSELEHFFDCTTDLTVKDSN